MVYAGLLLGWTIASFLAGAKYGKEVEAKAIAEGFKIDAGSKAEFQAIVAKLKTTLYAEYQRLAKYL